jgi:hypothetical protein
MARARWCQSHKLEIPTDPSQTSGIRVGGRRVQSPSLTSRSASHSHSKRTTVLRTTVLRTTVLTTCPANKWSNLDAGLRCHRVGRLRRA